MDTATVVVYLYNGTQIEYHFSKSKDSTVEDLREFVDKASGLCNGEPYQLIQIAPANKKLEDLQARLVPATILQVAEQGESSHSERPHHEAKIYAASAGGTLISGPYYEQIMLAFMFTATNLAGVALLTLLYYNSVMFWPYINPFFWAVVVGLTLRAPRDKICLLLLRTVVLIPAYIVNYLEPLSHIELETSNFALKYFRKTRYVVFEIVSNHNIPYVIIGSLFCLTLGVLYTSMLGMWEPVLVGVVVSVVVLGLLLIFLSPPTFTACLLISALLLTVGTLCIFATTSLIREGLALLTFLEPYIQSISQRKFAADAVMEMVGINQEYRTILSSLHEVVLSKLNSTAGQWGWNISELPNLGELSNLSTNFTDLSGSSSLSNNLPALEDIINYDYSSLVDIITSSWAVTTRNVVMQVSGWAFGTSFYVLKVVAQFSTSFYNMVISTTVFITSLYLMLVSSKNLVAEAIRMIPVANANNRMYEQIRVAFTGIVLTTFVTCGVNAVCIYIIVAWGADFMFPFLFTFVNALLTLFPVFYPWVLQALLVGYWLRGTGVSVLFIVSAFMDSLLYSSLSPKSSNSSVFPHQWVSGLSVVMGLYAFGLEGILLGPILVYVTIILYKAFVDALRDPRKRDSLSMLSFDSIRAFNNSSRGKSKKRK